MMLFNNAYLCTFVVLNLLSYSYGQYYDSDYRVKDDVEDEDYSSYTSDEPDRVDYSKYYAADRSSLPLIGESAEETGEENKGFVTPLDFPGLFTDGTFGLGSSGSGIRETFNQPFGLYTSATTQNQSGFVSPNSFQSQFFSNDFLPSGSIPTPQPNIYSNFNPGPSYVTHSISPSIKNNQKIKYQSYNPEKYKTDDEYSAYDNKYPKYESLKSTPKPFDAKTLYPLPPTLNTLSAKPQYYPTQQILPNAGIPYKKFSFQPTNYFDSSASNINYFNQPDFSPTNTDVVSANREDTEIVTRKICHKIEKDFEGETEEGGTKREPMTCFICKNARSGETYEQCSYSSKPNEKAYFVGQKYSSENPGPSSSYRYKRYAEKTYIKEEKDYQTRKRKHPKYKSKPKEFDSSYYKPEYSEYEEQESEQVYDDPNYYSFDPIVEKYATEQSEKLKKTNGKCKKIEKDSMTCMVCEDPDTGGNFEQCSYSSQPNDNKYAYTKEQNYDSNDSPEEQSEQENSEDESQQESITRQKNDNNEVCVEKIKNSMLCTVCRNPKTGGKSEQCSYRSEPSPRQYHYTNEREYRNGQKPSSENDREPLGSEEKPIKKAKKKQRKVRKEKKRRTKFDFEDDFSTPKKIQPKRKEKHFEKDIYFNEKYGVKPGGLGLDPDLYGKPVTFDDKDTDETEQKEYYVEHKPLQYEEHFDKLFPEYRAIRQEQGNDEINTPEVPIEYFADSSEKDVEKVLAEFAKKNRTNCKKIEKGKLTCFLCTDKNGMKNEECMYLQESEPKNSHKAYHKIQKFKSPPENIEENESKKFQVINFQQNASLPKVTSTSSSVLNTTERRNKKRRFRNFDSPKKPIKYSDTLESASGVQRYFYEKPPQDNDEIRAESQHRAYTTEPIEPPEPTKPVEFQVDGEEGAFASELKPIFSKNIGFTLPAFMLTKSEHEIDFDEVAEAVTDKSDNQTRFYCSIFPREVLLERANHSYNKSNW